MPLTDDAETLPAAASGERPFCAEAAADRGEALDATASRIEHWLLVEYGGYWPYEPLDAAVFAGSLREHLASQLARLRCSRLILVKRHGRARAGGVRVVYGVTREQERRFYSLELAGHPDLLDLDAAAALLGECDHPGAPLDHPLLLVCTHGVRDRCCARYGQALFRAAHALEPAWTWQASHVGGDRFAGNLLALPEGLYFGRVTGPAFATVHAEYVGGRVALDWYRGASCYPMRIQAAEVAVRRATGLTGFHDLAFAGHEDGRVRMRAEVAGDVYEVDTWTADAADEAFLTCRAERPRRARRFAAAEPRLVS